MKRIFAAALIAATIVGVGATSADAHSKKHHKTTCHEVGDKWHRLFLCGPVKVKIK